MQRTLFYANLLIACWLWMQIVHELGHVLGALATGGRVQQVVLHPLAISRTDVNGSSQLLVVIWAGPVIGCLLPVLFWAIAVNAKWSGAFLLRFFAGFCLIANGLYLAAGSFDGVGDCGDLLRHGAPIWTLWLFGAVATPAGFLLWHRQGRHFGSSPNAEPIALTHRRLVAGIAILTIVGELVWSAI